MKVLASLALLAAIASTALAQTISIQNPADGTTVQAGSNIIVEVIQHETLGDLIQVALAIGLGTPDLNPGIGNTILYNGPFNPQVGNTGMPTGQGPPTAFLTNFTLTIPASTPAGLMSLNAAHFTMVGDGNFPGTETASITLNVA
ncbi:hypothetical protein C8R45DRAFT_1098173 [Mycena sanguinolenta]|nr:hypothetical protein C8R45DRAFT_1098173 [Mycena sanguinolenta]